MRPPRPQPKSTSRLIISPHLLLLFLLLLCFVTAPSLAHRDAESAVIHLTDSAIPLCVLPQLSFTNPPPPPLPPLLFRSEFQPSRRNRLPVASFVVDLEPSSPSFISSNYLPAFRAPLSGRPPAHRHLARASLLARQMQQLQGSSDGRGCGVGCNNNNHVTVVKLLIF
jgi:hypothetical protein